MEQYKSISSFKDICCLEELFEKIKFYVNDIIDEALDTSELMKDLAVENKIIFDTIKIFLLGKGKRLRAILFYLTYTAYSEKPNWNNVNKAMMAIEFIHSFILIHDDVIDRSDIRRSNPTLHSSFDSIINKDNDNNLSLISGKDLAIVAGDMLYAFAIDKFHEVELEYSVFTKSLNILTKIAVQTAQGEFKELMAMLKPINNITEEDIYRIYDLKTAHYTFTAPMMLGAVLAEKEEDLENLERIALLMGRAFQIHNDISELEEFGGNIKNTTPKDLKEKKRTLILLFAYNNSEHEDKILIEKFLKSETKNILEYVEIYNIIIRGGAIEKAKQIINFLKNEALGLFPNLNVANKPKEAIQFYFNCLV